MSDRRRTQLSKALTFVLRHKAHEYGLTLSPDGYTDVAAVLHSSPIASLHASLEEVHAVVQHCSKQRFSLTTRDGRLLIRANQGHTLPTVQLDDAQLLTPVTLQQVKDGMFPFAVHGTSERAWKLIEQCGYLSRMARKHIHMASVDWDDADMVSGMRRSSEVLLYVDLRMAMEEAGLAFFLSANRVLLTPGDEQGRLPLIFVQRVRHLR